MRRALIFSILFGSLIAGLFFLFWRNNDRSSGPRIGDGLPIESLLKQSGTTDLPHQYVLLKFWGSWCGPCRIEHPHWVELYEQFSNSPDGQAAFSIIGIALETDSLAWMNAIRTDGLPWKGHIMQDRDPGKGWAARVKLQSVPENILLDSTGLIVGRNMSVREVRRFLRHRLTK